MRMRLIGCAVWLAFVLPAFGQSTDFQSLFSGKDIPLNLKLKDLNGDWRRLSLGGANSSKGGGSDLLSQLAQIGMAGDKNKKPDDSASAALGISLLTGGLGGSKDPTYYTKGQTVTVGSETFLVAYLYEKKEVDFLQLIADSAKNGGKDPDFTRLLVDNKLTADSPLTMALVNIKSITTLRGIRPFDMAQEIADSAQSGGSLADLIASSAAKDKGNAQNGGKATGSQAEAPKEAATYAADYIKGVLMDDAQLYRSHAKIAVTASGKTLTLKGTVASVMLKAHAGNVVQRELKSNSSDLTVNNQLMVHANQSK